MDVSIQFTTALYLCTYLIYMYAYSPFLVSTVSEIRLFIQTDR